MRSLSALILCIFTIVFFHKSDSSASQKWTSRDTQEYYRGLSPDNQQRFIKETISGQYKDLPIQIDFYTTWDGIVYLSSSNTITQHITANVAFGSIDDRALQEHFKGAKLHSINSLCSKTMFKMFMFETDTIVRVEFDYFSGQKMFGWSLGKEDCIEGGYSYP